MNDISSSFQRLFDILDYIVDPRVGIIQEIMESKRDSGAPDLFGFYARACNTGALGPQVNFLETGGTSINRKSAMAKAIGEAIERYCSALYSVDELPFFAFNSAPFACTPPETFALFSQKQFTYKDFPYQPFTRETKVHWTSAVDAFTRETWFVPAAMVYLPYFFEAGESPIIPSISTGLACHCSEAEAALSAICEVIERDAFTITWQGRLSPPQIVIETLPEANRSLVARYQRTGAQINLFDITLDHGIPTILSTMKYPNFDAPAFLLSAATHSNPEVAISKSLEELELGRRLAKFLKEQTPPIIPTPGFENIETQLSHIRLFCEHDNAHIADFLFEGDLQVEFSALSNLTQSSSEKEMQVLVERINRIGHRVLLTDVTTSDIKGLGLWVIRAVIPGFHPLFFGHRFRALGGTRLWEIPQSLGYPGVSPQKGDNPVPHPYP